MLTPVLAGADMDDASLDAGPMVLHMIALLDYLSETVARQGDQ